MKRLSLWVVVSAIVFASISGCGNGTQDKIITAADLYGTNTNSTGTTLPLVTVPQLPSNCSEYSPFGDPSSGGLKLCKGAFLLSYNYEHKTSDWVAERVTRERLLYHVIDRTDDFQPDPSIFPLYSAHTTDYSFSGYDMGHLSPAANNEWNVTAMHNSFNLDNVVPQDHQQNAGKWLDIENLIRSWAITKGELLVYTGPVYRHNPIITIGAGKVAVPSHLYKIAYDPKSSKSISFMIPNAPVPPGVDLSDFIVSVSDIESVTGLHFLPSLPGRDNLASTRSSLPWI